MKARFATIATRSRIRLRPGHQQDGQRSAGTIPRPTNPTPSTDETPACDGTIARWMMPAPADNAASSIRPGVLRLKRDLRRPGGCRPWPHLLADSRNAVENISHRGPPRRCDGAVVACAGACTVACCKSRIKSCIMQTTHWGCRGSPVPTNRTDRAACRPALGATPRIPDPLGDLAATRSQQSDLPRHARRPDERRMVAAFTRQRKTYQLGPTLATVGPPRRRQFRYSSSPVRASSG